MTKVIKWEEPISIGRTKWTPVLNELRDNPGVWALVAENTNAALASSIKNGTLGDSRKGEFEAVSRKSAQGKTNIYARFVGRGE